MKHKDKHRNKTPSSKLTAATVMRGYETFVKDNEITMLFDTKKDAIAFFDWLMENTKA